MKRIHFFLLPLVALLLTSCNDVAVSTPGLQASTQLFRTSVDGVCDTISITDTLQIGDTVLMRVAAYGNYNNLTGLRAQTDTNCMKLGFVWNHKDDTFLIAGSDPEHGVLLFMPKKINICVTALRYIPVQFGTHRVDLTVSSDAGKDYSPRTFYFDVVVAKPAN